MRAAPNEPDKSQRRRCGNSACGRNNLRGHPKRRRLSPQYPPTLWAKGYETPMRVPDIRALPAVCAAIIAEEGGLAGLWEPPSSRQSVRRSPAGGFRKALACCPKWGAEFGIWENPACISPGPGNFPPIFLENPVNDGVKNCDSNQKAYFTASDFFARNCGNDNSLTSLQRSA